MRTSNEIERLLDGLDTSTADSLEDQDLDFKEWSHRSMADSVAMVVEMAICMANGGGGTVVFGVSDKAIGRLLLMQVYPGLPPYTDTSGRGKVRVGKDCQPLTGTLRRHIMVETGETDFTAEIVEGRASQLLSTSALENLRDAARRERAPQELLRLSDEDLLAQIGVLQSGRLTRAAVLLAGKAEAIRDAIPGFSWTHLRMESETRYTDRADDTDALPTALSRLIERINADNPIATLEHGMFHFEYRTYPEIALREALLNALCHAEFRISGRILVKQFPDRLEISNSGGFIAGITPENILLHPPAARNPRLVDALTRLRLVNRSSLGVNRMFEALLVEGKEPPLIHETGESVIVTFRRREFSPVFRLFVAEERKAGRALHVDHLLVLQFLLAHTEIDSATAARLCQRTEPEGREILSVLEHQFGYLERGDAGRGSYWTLRHDLHRRLAGSGHPDRDRRIDWEAAKARILSVLRDRARRGEAGLSNEDVREITHYDRHQARRLIQELMRENPEIQKGGTKRWTRYAHSMP